MMIVRNKHNNAARIASLPSNLVTCRPRSVTHATSIKAALIRIVMASIFSNIKRLVPNSTHYMPPQSTDHELGPFRPASPLAPLAQVRLLASQE